MVFSGWRTGAFIFSSVLACGMVSLAWAAGSTVEGREVQSTSVTVVVAGKSSTKPIFCYRGKAGTAKSRPGSKFLFTTYADLIKTTKAKTPKSTKLPLYKALNKAGGPACKALPVIPTSTPTQGPAATPTSSTRPTATPTVAAGNFDSQGNVTAQGKVAFQIPSNLSANITRGKSTHSTFCTGCHSEKLNKTYPQLDSSIRLSPMLYDDSQINSSQRADLVAYLNRFKTQ